jgi:hypothetical protein
MKRFFALGNVRLAIELTLIAILLPLAFSRASVTQAASQDIPQAAGTKYWYQCDSGSNHIGLFSNRIHIYCATTTPISGAPALTGIHWFAYPTSPDSAEASRFMSLLQTAVITSRPVWMQLDPTDTSGASFGCGSGDCRRIYGMEMR